MGQFVIVIILFWQTSRRKLVQRIGIINIQLFYLKSRQLQRSFILHNSWIKLFVMAIYLDFDLFSGSLYLLFICCCVFYIECSQLWLLVLKRGFEIVHLFLNQGYRCLGVIVNTLFMYLFSHLNSRMMRLHFLNLLLIHGYFWWNVFV